MEDNRIIDLYWARIEDAIRATGEKYGRLCHCIANNILASHEDCEECVNDTYLGLWNAIPPERPVRFSVFVSRITRNLALKRYEYLSAAKRNPEAVCSLEELEDCVSGGDTVESEMENRRIEAAIDDFLWQQGEEKRHVFILRYWYFASIGDISRRTGFS
ncbi:MAG: sigma-70 family RNA polymerase sigma factor, partial [Oscillospiraceae bacterium]|nr:sigma-70 family RNA polymerase sigma factor [Oscillospiraceae bacterium]